jgi:hypothetical protein
MAAVPSRDLVTDRYAEKKSRERDRQADQSVAGRDIGKPPKCQNPKRRKGAEKSLRKFCEVYLAARFPLAWSKDHLTVLAKMEEVVLDGGLYALAMPRGSGKTALCEAAALWAALIGTHQFVALLAATKTHAVARLGSIKRELLNNELVLADWPEVCFPIRAMGGIANRCRGQTVGGTPTDMTWGRSQIVLPTVAGSQSSAVVLVCGGLLEAVRGLNYTRPDGAVTRPTLAVIDDPQTRRSARSKVQSQERETILAGDVLYLPGPGKKISAVMPCTVIEPADMADRILDRKRNPEWQGIRTKLLYQFPTNMKLWDAYADMRRDEWLNGTTSHKISNAFYRKHRKLMDAGGKVAWEERKSPGELSALQHAMNLYYRDPNSFAAEMQNEPEKEERDDQVETLSAEQLAVHVSAFKRGEIPLRVERLTYFLDVHKELIYWVVCGFEPGFSGHVIDYGTWPKQGAAYFDMRHARQPISTDPRITATTLEGRVTQALDFALAELAGRDWHRADGVLLPLDFGMVDANWGEVTDEVYDVAASAHRRHGLIVMPSHGVPFGPAKCPIARWDRKKTKGLFGDEWHIPPVSRGRPCRHVTFDAGRRKSFLHRRLATPPGDPGALTFFHAPASTHRLISEHCTAETGTKVSGPYGDLTIWTALPGRDNHWFDCLSGCCTAESIRGGKLGAGKQAGVVVTSPAPARRRRTFKF